MNAYGTLVQQRGKAMTTSIRCPECAGRFAPPREYSPELRLMSELHTNAADLLVVAGKIIATHDTEMVRQFYCGEIRTRINALYDALDRYESGER